MWTHLGNRDELYPCNAYFPYQIVTSGHAGLHLPLCQRPRLSRAKCSLHAAWTELNKLTTASKVRVLLGKMKTTRRGIRRGRRRKRAGSRAEWTEQETGKVRQEHSGARPTSCVTLVKLAIMLDLICRMGIVIVPTKINKIKSFIRGWQHLGGSVG